MNKLLLLADINSAHTQKWAVAIAQAGWKVFIFGLHEIKNDWYSEHGIEVRSYNLSLDTASGSSLDKLKYLKAKKDAKAYAEEVKPDIIHAHYATSYGMLGRSLKRRPFVLSLWGSEVYSFPQKSFVHRMFFKRILRYPDVVCSTSRDMAETCQRIIDRKIAIVPFGIDTEYFSPKDERDHEVLTIGTVKSLEDVYGIDRLIEAYSIFKKKSAVPSRLVVFGSGSKEMELKQHADRMGVKESVSFRGFVSGEDLINAYSELDIYCALSRHESFGVAILEAESMELPVIVSDAGGLKEVVLPNETGFIVQDGEPNLAAEKMLQLIEAGQRKTMGVAARKFVKSNFDFELNLKQQIEIYERLMK